MHAVESKRVTRDRAPAASSSASSAATARRSRSTTSTTELRPRLAEILALLCAHPDGMSAERAVRRPARRRRQRRPACASRSRGCASCSARGSTPTATGSPATSRPTCAASRACSPRGAVREAAEAYPGPLLPSSEAPGVVRERERLDAWLRQAVMTADDPEALWAWVHTPTGEDDLGAWKRLLTQLEFRDPRRSLCRRPRGRAAACSADVTPEWSTECSIRTSEEETAGMRGDEAHRGLSTARAALQVTWLLARAPDGVRADEVARDARQERLDRLQPARQPVRRGRRRAPPRRPLPARARLPRDRRRGVRPPRPLRRRRRPARAHAQARLPGGAARRPAARRARARPAGHAEAARDEPRDRATTRTRWRSARSCSRSARARRVERYAERRPQALHARRPSPTRDALLDELRARPPRRGVAAEREEFEPRLLLPRRARARPRAPLPRRRRHLDVAHAPSTTSARSSRRPSATSSDSKHLRMSAMFLIAVRTADLASPSISQVNDVSKGGAP